MTKRYKLTLPQRIALLEEQNRELMTGYLQLTQVVNRLITYLNSSQSDEETHNVPKPESED